MRARHTSKALALLLALAIALLGALPALAASTPDAALTAVLNYLDGKRSSLAFGSGESEWKALALARGGKTVPSAYVASIESAVKADSLSASTDYARTVLALTAMGIDASDFADCNLLEPLTDIDFVTEHLPNGPTFALLALNSHNAYASKFPAGYDLALVDVLLSEYTALGWTAGWAIGVDIDATAMALQALAPYYSHSNVKTVVDSAVALLSGAQLASGAFANDYDYGVFDDACSTAQVITALSVLGMDAATALPRNAVSALLAFQEADGGFDAAWGENPFADSQAAYALVAYDRYGKGANSLFDMSDAFSEEPAPLTTLEKWEAKLPGWLSFIKSWPDWIKWIVYCVSFGWVWA